MFLVSIPEVLQSITNIPHIDLNLPDGIDMCLFIGEV